MVPSFSPPFTGTTPLPSCREHTRVILIVFSGRRRRVSGQSASNPQTDADSGFHGALVPFVLTSDHPYIHKLSTNVFVCQRRARPVDLLGSLGSCSSTELIVKGLANSRQAYGRFLLQTSEGLTHKTQEIITCLILQFLSLACNGHLNPRRQPIEIEEEGSLLRATASSATP